MRSLLLTTWDEICGSMGREGPAIAWQAAALPRHDIYLWGVAWESYSIHESISFMMQGRPRLVPAQQQYGAAAGCGIPAPVAVLHSSQRVWHSSQRQAVLAQGRLLIALLVGLGLQQCQRRFICRSAWRPLFL